MDEKTSEPLIVIADPPAEATPPEPAPPGTDMLALRIYSQYFPQMRCMNCNKDLQLRVFQGMPPRGHDDSLVYQEIVVIGVHKCTCGVQVPQLSLVKG